MSGSVSPLPWTGSKGCIYTTIDAFMPPHKTYVEACMGSAEVFLRKKPAEREIINDYNGDLVKFFRVLQQNEKLAYLLGRLYLSFNSEELFRINKAMLADVPNILDDLTETSVTVEKAEWSDIEKAVEESDIRIRDDSVALINYCRENKVPFLLFSAGIGDVLEVVVSWDGES